MSGAATLERLAGYALTVEALVMAGELDEDEAKARLRELADDEGDDDG